jgi:hypothetical protein
MKTKDSRLVGSIYKINDERIIGINVGHDMFCEISKLISGNRNKMDSIEAIEIEDESELIGSRIVIHNTNQIFKLFIPDNKVNFWFDIPNNVKPKTTTQEETVEQGISEEIELEHPLTKFEQMPTIPLEVIEPIPQPI